VVYGVWVKGGKGLQVWVKGGLRIWVKGGLLEVKVRVKGGLYGPKVAISLSRCNAIVLRLYSGGVGSGLTMLSLALSLDSLIVTPAGGLSGGDPRRCSL
jgi:hypothetical protein